MNNSNNLPEMNMSYNCGKSFNPVSELMRAMILRTVEDYNSLGELRDGAVAYMMDPDEEYVLSFRSVCKQMGLDPDKTRYAIMNADHRISTRRRAA